MRAGWLYVTRPFIEVEVISCDSRLRIQLPAALLEAFSCPVSSPPALRLPCYKGAEVRPKVRDFLVIQWPRLCAPNAGGLVQSLVRN